MNGELKQTFERLETLFENRQLTPLTCSGFRALYQMADAIRDRDQTVDFPALKDQLKHSIKAEGLGSEVMELARQFYMVGRAVLSETPEPEPTKKHAGGRPVKSAGKLIGYLTGMAPGSTKDRHVVARKAGISPATMTRLLRAIRNGGSELAQQLSELGVSVVNVQVGKITSTMFTKDHN